MIFIELHDKQTGNPVMINIDRIDSLTNDGFETVIYVGTTSYTVDEGVNKIMAAIQIVISGERATSFIEALRDAAQADLSERDDLCASEDEGHMCSRLIGGHVIHGCDCGHEWSENS